MSTVPRNSATAGGSNGRGGVKTTSPFLDLRALAGMAHLRFTTRHFVEGSYSGRHQSRQHGGSGEFVDFREYYGGEDLRRLDWKVYGRTGKAFVRLHQEETNLACLVGIDCSGSMSFGGIGGSNGRAPARFGGKKVPTTKLEYAQYFATALSHIISLSQDQVGIAELGGRLGEFAPPRGAPMHVATVQSMIASLKTSQSTTMAESLRDVYQRTSRRGVLLLISDFLMEDLEEVFGALRTFRQRAFEVILLHLVHPDEESLPTGSAYRFLDMEAAGSIHCTPAMLQEEYERRFRAHMAAVRRLALATGSDYRRVSTATPYLDTLGTFLRTRSG